MSEKPVFGTVGFYQAVADDLNADETWLEMAKPITYTMVFVYEEPINKNFSLRFEAGRITEVSEVEDPQQVGADFVINGKPAAWRGLIKKELDPNSAMATGKVKIDGKQTVLLRHMKKFSYMIDKMTSIDADFGDS